MGFFTKKPYNTWQEAAVASKKVGITDTLSWRDVQKKDKRLPEEPNRFYKDFPGWSAFFAYQKE